MKTNDDANVIKLIVASVEVLVVLELCHGCGELAVVGDGVRLCPRC